MQIFLPRNAISQQRNTLRDWRPSMAACPCLLDDGDTGIEIVYSEEKNILYWADQSSQGRTKNSCTGTPSPTNQPRKDPFSFALFESPFTSVSVSTGGINRGNFDESQRLLSAGLSQKNVDLSQIIDSVPQGQPMDLFPAAESRVEGVSLPFYLCLYLNLCFLFCFLNVCL